MLIASYTFLDVMWSMIVFFAWVIWFWLLITVFADLFSRHDIGGGMKVLWMIFVIILPYLGVFIYLIAEHQGIADRGEKKSQASQAQRDEDLRRGGRNTERRPSHEQVPGTDAAAALQ